MYEGTIKSTIIAGRTQPNLSAEMSGNAYTEGEKIIFDDIIKTANRLWAKKGNEYLLLASGSSTFISYDTSSINPYGTESNVQIDTNEVPSGFIPQDTTTFREKIVQKTSERVLDGDTTNKVKSEYIIWYSSQRELTLGDFADLTANELIIAYHEIYARHGKIFKTTWLQEWFNQCSWYDKTLLYNYKDDDSNLSSLEAMNAAKINEVINHPELLGVAVARASKNEVGDIARPINDNVDSSEYVFAYSDKKLLTMDDIYWIQEIMDTDRDDKGNRLDGNIQTALWQVQTAINEIYARHGRKFNNADTQSYFESKSWYKASDTYNYDDDNSTLNPVELANIKFLSNFRDKYINGKEADREKFNTDRHNAIDFMNTFDVIDTQLGRYAESSIDWDAATGKYKSSTTGLSYSDGKYYLNGVQIFAETGDIATATPQVKDIEINGVKYQLERAGSERFVFGDKEYSGGVRVTNTQSGEFVILGPGGMMFQPTAEGYLEQTKNQRNINQYAFVDPETNKIVIESSLNEDGTTKSALQIIREHKDAETERANREIELKAKQRFIQGGNVNDYVETFNQTRTDKRAVKRTMRLFGLPRQFTKQVDPRPTDISTNVGRKFLENMVLEAPVITIIPGEPKYMKGDSDKQKSTTMALWEGTNGNMDALKSLMINQNPGKYLRYYDFQSRYIDYMKYVNILCRTMAGFLELTDELDGTPLTQYDWRNYRWDGQSYQHAVSQVTDTLGGLITKAGYKLDSTVKRITSIFADGTIKTSYQVPSAEGEATATETTPQANTAENVASTEGETTETTTTTNPMYTSRTELFSNAKKLIEEAKTVISKAASTAATTQSTENNSENTESNTDSTESTDSTETTSEQHIMQKETPLATSEEEIPLIDSAYGMFESTGGTRYKVNENGEVVEVKHEKNEVIFETTTEDSESLEEIVETYLTMHNYVQFFIDPSSGVSESIANATGESQFKGLFDNVSQTLKEIMFISNSGGVDISAMQEVIDNGLDAAGSVFSSLGNGSGLGGAVGSVLGRILNMSGNILRGENIIMPQIYQSSQYSKEYTVTIHLKAEDGSKLSQYFDVLVPLAHLICLGLPRQTTTNTYGSPFLVKCFVDGVFTCNLGMVTGLSIDRNVSPESWTAEGMPNEMDVQLQITDLYSDLTISPQNEPLMFLNNSSLIEYLATTCGLSLVTPQFKTKVGMILNTLKNSILDIPENIADWATLNEQITGAIQSFNALSM